MIYLDNAATSYPKPPAVVDAAAEALRSGGNPGRGSHGLATGGVQKVVDTRVRLARLLGIPDPRRLAFFLNATDALNAAIKGWVRPGDRVVTTNLEHNSVLRPLVGLSKRAGVEMVRVPVDASGYLDPASIHEALAAAPTRLLAVTHASNVLGTIQPVEDLIGIAHALGVPVLVDAAQTAGEIPLDAAALDVDMLAVSGHKGLLGPQGTGALYVRPGLELVSWREGGTGTHSECLEHPPQMPELLEAGTCNLPGLCGLGAAVDYLLTRGVPDVQHHVAELISRLVEGLAGDRRFVLYGMAPPGPHVGVVSLNVLGLEAGDVGMVLEESFGIAARTGLHCAAPAHRSIGTFPSGTVRVSPGAFSTKDDIDALVHALHEIASA